MTTTQQVSQPMPWGQVAKNTALFLLAGVGTGLLLRHFINKGVANKAQNRSANRESPEFYAKQFEAAFQNDGWPGMEQ